MREWDAKMIPAIALAKATPHAIGVTGALLAAVSLQLAQITPSGSTESNFFTVLASVLASTGVVGYAAKRFIDHQVRRSEARADEERKERELDRADMLSVTQRLYDEWVAQRAFFETQITLWQTRADAERDRSDKLILQVIGKQTVINEGGSDHATDT